MESSRKANKEKDFSEEAILLNMSDQVAASVVDSKKTQQIREKNQPTGLRNIGNTCYFNSLMQVYYNMPTFVQSILKFQVEKVP